VRANSAALLALFGCSLAAGRASGAPPEQLQLRSNSSCPSAADVVSELAPLLPHTRVEEGAEGEAMSDAESASMVDEGESLRVRVAAQERIFRDPERSCRERARTAAVFIGLVLDPPVLPEAKPPAAPPPPAPPPPPPPQLPAEATTPLSVQLGPLLETAPVSDVAERPLAGGFGGRLASGGTLGVAVGAAFLLPTRLVLPHADARMVWLPFDVSPRLTYEAGPVALSGELGPELALLFVSGDRVKNPRTSTRVEAGLRAATSLTWNMSTHLGAFVTLFGVWRPRPYEFRVNPRLENGTTPPVWLGASLGFAFRAR